MTRALRAWAINLGGKNSVRNLRYGPRTWLVRGMNGKIHPQLIFDVFLSVCFCLDKCGQAMIDRMDLSSKDALSNFVNASEHVKIYFPWKAWGFT